LRYAPACHRHFPTVVLGLLCIELTALTPSVVHLQRPR
jgi:hypothetical protein